MRRGWVTSTGPRVELADRTLILTSDNPDKTAYPVRTFTVRQSRLPDILTGEVVWSSRTIGPRKTS